MAEFKSSARRIAFNPVTLPDTASKYLRAEEERIKRLKEVYDTDIKNRNQYADALDRKQAAEERNVESNSRLKEKFNATYAQQLKERYRQLNQKEADKTKAYEQRLTNMAQFSETAGNELKAFGERRAKNQQNIGFNLYNETGVDPQQLQEYRLKKAELAAEGVAEAEYVASLQAKGVDVASLRRVEGLSGWRLVGAQKAMAMKAGSDWKAFTENPERRNKQYDIGDGNGTMMSLEEAMNSQDPNQDDFNTVLTQMRLEFTEAYSDLSPEFAHDHFWPGVNKATEYLQQEFRTKDQEAYRAGQVEEAVQSVSNSLMERDENGNIDLSLLHGHLGGGRLGWERIHEAVGKLIEIGDITIDDLEDLENSYIFKDGKNVRYKEHFATGKGKKGSYFHSAFLKSARDKLHDRSVNDRKINEARLDASATEAVEQFIATANTSGISPSQYEKWSSTYIATYNKQPPAFLKTYATNETYGISEAEAILEEKYLDGTLTSDDLKMKAFQRLDPSRRQKYQQLAGLYEEKASSDLMKEHEKDIKNAIGKSLKVSTFDAPTEQLNTVTFHATQYYRSLVKDLISNSDYPSPNAAASQAFKMISEEIKSGRDDKNPTGRFITNRDSKGFLDLENPGFEMLRSEISQHSDTSKLRSSFGKQYDLDNDVITKKKLFGKIDDSQSLISRLDTSYRNGGSIPQAVKDVAVTDLDRSVLDVINSQLEVYGLKPIKASRDQAVQYATDPEFRRLITHMTSEGRVSRGLVNTNYKNGVVGVPAYKPILDLIASKESSNDTVHNGYDSLNTGGTDSGHTAFGSSTGTKKFQKPLTEMTVEEVMNLQNDGVLHATGRYQIIRSTLANVVRQVGLDPKTTKYDEATQDLLAIHLLWGRVGKQLRTDGQALVGLGQEWVGLQYVSAADKINALERTKSDPRFKNFDPVRLYPNLVGK